VLVLGLVVELALPRLSHESLGGGGRRGRPG
jgi:hypothetical protein